jgi:hypothetical protein
MNFIKYVDFFGLGFQFYINNQPTYQNVFGGVMSILFIISCLALFFTYNLNELKKQNPISTISEYQFATQDLINLHDEKIWIPFRIVTDENKYIDHKNIMQINPLLVKGKFDINIGMDLSYYNITYKLCNETSMVNHSEYYKIDIPLNELYCFDQDNITFGGDWTKNYIHYIQIGLYICDGIAYNASDPRCSGLIKLMDSINSSLFFDLYYPVVQFQPTNLKMPVSIIYKNYFYRLGTYSNKLEKLYIQEHILSDDLNLITNDAKNISFWGANSFFDDSYALHEMNDPIFKNDLFRSFILEIYPDTGFKFYTRTYKKLFLLISNVFPFFNLIYYLFQYFTYYIKLIETKRKLCEYIFVKKDLKLNKVLIKKSKRIGEKKNNIQNNLNLNLNMNILFDEQFKSKSTLTVHKIKEHKLSSSNNQSNIALADDNIINVLNKKELLTLKKNNQNKNELIDNKSGEIIPSVKRKGTILKKSKNKNLFPHFYFFFDLFLDRLIYPKSFFCVTKLYMIVYRFMCRMYDVSSHLFFYKQIITNKNIITEIVSKEKIDYQSKIYNKINIKDEKLMEKINNDLLENKSLL